MFQKTFLYLKNFDWIIFFPIILLASFGLIEIYSIALGQETVDLTNFYKQLLFVGMGLASMIVLTLLDYRVIKDYSKYLYIGGIVLLIGVLMFGSTVRGATSWFDLGFFGFQPVEFIKIILIIFLAKYFSSKQSKAKPWKQLVLSGVGTMILFFLVFLQPDFGSALLLFAVWFFMLAVAGFDKKYFFIIALIGVVILGFLWNFSFQDYQKERIMTFLTPSSNSLEQGYNISQAIIAVGAGGLVGRGVGFGSQSQLKFLPEAHNDFIFAVIAEELGLVGVLLVVSFFSIFFFKCLMNVKKLDNDFGIFFILGGAGLIFIEMFINIGMNIGLLPVVGISLPFISYGGSAIIAKFAIIGIMQNIIIKSKIR
ncbi:MAG: rod shape-determining protein RodA [Patescibacteria group bacterium]